MGITEAENSRQNRTLLFKLPLLKINTCDVHDADQPNIRNSDWRTVILSTAMAEGRNGAERHATLNTPLSSGTLSATNKTFRKP